MFSLEKNKKDRLYDLYLKEAIHLARLNDGNPEDASNYIDGDRFQSFDEHTQNIILYMADFLKEENLLDKDSAIIKKKIRKNPEIQDEFTTVMAAISRWEKLLKPAHATQAILDSTGKHYPYPPIDWAVSALGDISGIVGDFSGNQINKYTLFQEKPSKISNIPKLIADFSAMLGITLNFAAPAATLLVMAAPLLLVVAASFMVVLQGRNFVKSVKALIQEIKEKEPKETYRLRVRSRVLSCVKEGAGALFYVALLGVAIAQFASIFTNPIGLGVFTGVVGALGGGMVITTVITQRLRKRTEKRLLKREKELGLEPDLDRTEPDQKIGNSLKNRASSAINKLRGKSNTDTAEPTGQKTLRTLRTVRTAKSNLACRARKMSAPAFNQLQDASIEMLEAKKKEVDSLYQGVEYKSKTVVGKARTLAVDVPREGLSLAKERSSDQITRSQNAKKEVEMTLSAEPALKSIKVFLDMHRNLAPLQMDYCGNPKTVVEIRKVAEELKVKIQFDPRDIELVKDLERPLLHL
jgi:hypothetical protein